MMEWRQCKLSPRYYISEYGDLVCAKTNKRLKGSINYDGYPSFNITLPNGKKIQQAAHRLVALSFLPCPQKGQNQVRHKNGSKLFCHYSNLQWGTAMENREDTRRHGTSSARGERNPKAKITEDDVRYIRMAHRRIKEGRSEMKIKDLAEKFDLHIATICNIARKKSWAHVLDDHAEDLAEHEAIVEMYAEAMSNG